MIILLEKFVPFATSSELLQFGNSFNSEIIALTARTVIVIFGEPFGSPSTMCLRPASSSVMSARSN